MRMFSADDYRYDTYQMSVADVTSLVFSLQACHDGHIALSEIPGNIETQTYEFVIGGANDTESLIRLSPLGTTAQVRRNTAENMLNNYYYLYLTILFV